MHTTITFRESNVTLFNYLNTHMDSDKLYYDIMAKG